MRTMMITNDKRQRAVDALREYFPEFSSEYLEQIASDVLKSQEQQCTSTSPVHGVRCELDEHDNRFHTAGAFSWAGSSVYSPGVSR